MAGNVRSHATYGKLMSYNYPFLDKDKAIEDTFDEEYAYKPGCLIQATFGGEGQAAYVPRFTATGLDQQFKTTAGNLLMKGVFTASYYSALVTKSEKWINTNGSMQG